MLTLTYMQQVGFSKIPKFKRAFRRRAKNRCNRSAIALSMNLHAYITSSTHGYSDVEDLALHISLRIGHLSHGSLLPMLEPFQESDYPCELRKNYLCYLTHSGHKRLSNIGSAACSLFRSRYMAICVTSFTAAKFLIVCFADDPT